MSIFDTPLGAVGAPTAVLDLAAFRRNLETLRDVAAPVPLRVATKSIRVRGLIEEALRHDGVRGLLCYSVREAHWLVGHGLRDALVAYPSVDVDAMRAVAADEKARAEVTLMVDSPEHVTMASEAAQEAGGSLRLAIDVDMTYTLGPIHAGAHRSNVRTPEDAVRLAQAIERAGGVELVGCMFYEAQIAGIPDSTPMHRVLKWASMREIEGRRRAVVEALRAYSDLEILNGGGTGSAHISGRDGVLNDIAVGSGLYTPRLFDDYRALRTEPACYFVTPVVRKPDEAIVVTYSGGYIGSGPPHHTRVPTPVHPADLKYYGQLGAGEVQTPLHGEAARELSIGDHVWFRHAKAGEMCERFDSIVVVEGGAVADELATYRGEGQNFG